MADNVKKIRILPSLLSANFLQLKDEINQLIMAGVELLHIDVMDNHYVPNLTFGPLLAKSIKEQCSISLDIHLMATPVDDLITAFAPYADRISIHPDATIHLDRSLQLIRDNGCQAGLVLNPHTSLDCLTWSINKLDYVLVMTVNPGFGGQALIPHVIPKITQLNQLYPHIPIAVDGGVNEETIASLSDAGAVDFIAGSAVFHSQDYQKTLKKLYQLASR